MFYFASNSLALSGSMKNDPYDSSTCRLFLDSIRGNWFDVEDSQNWKLGIYDSVIIYDLEVWKLSKIENRKKYLIFSVRNNKNYERKIYLKSIKKGLKIGYSIDNMEFLLRKENSEFRYINQEASNFDKFYFHPDTAYYEGYIEGYSSNEIRYGKIITNNILLVKQVPSLIEIFQDGRFHTKVPLQYLQQVSVLMPSYESSIFLTPGKKTLLYLDMNDISKSQFMGANQTINSELFNYNSYQYFLPYDNIPDSISSMNPYDFKEFCISYKEEQLFKAKQYADSLKISTKSRKFIANSIEIVTYLNILSYNKYLPQYFDALNLSPEFYDFLDENIISSQMGLSANSAFFLYHKLLSNLRRPPTLAYKYNKLYQILIDSEECEDSIKLKDLLKCLSDDDIIAFQSLDSSYWINFDLKYSTTIDSILKSANFEDISVFNLDRFFGINNGLVKDIIQSMNVSLTDQYLPKRDTDKVNKMIKSNISYEPFQTYLTSYYTTMIDTALRKENLTKFDVKYEHNENLIDSLLHQYKGKFILIDFWATWCAPCIKNSRRFIEIKKNLNQDDYKFVYITNQSSPYDKWMSFADEFGGEHYRVDNNTWNILSTKFQVSGIPHYVLYDKNGILIDSDFNINYENEKLIEILSNLK